MFCKALTVVQLAVQIELVMIEQPLAGLLQVQGAAVFADLVRGFGSCARTYEHRAQVTIAILFTSFLLSSCFPR